MFTLARASFVFFDRLYNSTILECLDDSTNARNKGRECFPSSNIKADLMFARRMKRRYPDIGIQILGRVSAGRRNLNGINAVTPLGARVRRTISRISALALARPRFSTMRPAGIALFCKHRGSMSSTLIAGGWWPGESGGARKGI